LAQYTIAVSLAALRCISSSELRIISAVLSSLFISFNSEMPFESASPPASKSRSKSFLDPSDLSLSFFRPVLIAHCLKQKRYQLLFGQIDSFRFGLI